MAKSKPLNFKLVLLGDTSVGKSSCVERFVKNEFFDFQEPTIGAAFFNKTVNLERATSVKFEIWDTAGQERYRSLAPMYYRGAAAAVVVYDITSSESLAGAKGWIEELHRQASADIIMGLAGNKLDLASKRQVPTEEAKAYATENDCFFFETSAKTGENIEDLFKAIAHKLATERPRADDDSLMTVGIGDTGEKKKCCG